jgi:hypothetical protein
VPSFATTPAPISCVLAVEAVRASIVNQPVMPRRASTCAKGLV